MNNKKINLDKIIQTQGREQGVNNAFQGSVTNLIVRNCIKEGIRQALALAAEEVDLTTESYQSAQEGSTCEVDKKSILDIINYIE